MRYYIINLQDGSYCGTDNESTAREVAKSENHIVIDKEKDEVIDYTLSTRRSPILKV